MIALALLQPVVTVPPPPALSADQRLRCDVFSRDGRRHVLSGDYRQTGGRGELTLSGKSRLLPVPLLKKPVAQVRGQTFAMTVQGATEYRYDLQLSLTTGIMLVSTRKIPSGLVEYVGTGICDVKTGKAAS